MDVTERRKTMRVFVTGASGAIGSRLVPQLIEAGHEVTGTYNSPASAERLRRLGANPVMVDLVDARAVRKAVLESGPEAIVHEATALANAKWGRNVDKTMARTNALRTKGTDALLAAAREAGVRRFVTQSALWYVAALDLQTQKQLAGKFQRLLLQETPIVIPYWIDNLTASTPNVGGLNPTSIAQIYLNNAYKS
jgi:NAD dependent epimerase/dehydratase family enzyme